MQLKTVSPTSNKSKCGEQRKLLHVVRGYHGYESSWEPYLCNEFSTKHEKSNPHDKYTIAVLPVDDKVTKIVDHLPKEISKEWCLFIFQGGNISGATFQGQLLVDSEKLLNRTTHGFCLVLYWHQMPLALVWSSPTVSCKVLLVDHDPNAGCLWQALFFCPS